MAHPYRVLARTPHVVPLLLWSIAARMHFGGIPIAITFLVADWTGSYAWAGTVVGGLTLGTAVAGPLRGRMLDTGRADRIMVVSGVGYAAGLTAIAVLPTSLWWLSLPLALATGLFSPPANQLVRASWPRILTGQARQSIYAVEGSLQELIFIAGPLLAAGAVAAAGGRAATGALAVVVLVGSLGMAAAVRRAGLVHAPEPEADAPPADRRALLSHRPILLLTGFVLVLVAGIGSVDLAIVAFAREVGSPGHAGGLAATWAVGSLVGGLVAGTLAGVPRLGVRAFGATLGLAALVPLVPPVLDLPSPWLLTPVLFVAGLAIAPTLAAGMSRLGDVAPPARRAEAFGWLNTAAATGFSAAAPLTGALIDWGGIAAGFAGGAALVLGGAALSLFAPKAPAP